MSVRILSSSPNHDGLTAACVEAAKRGLSQAGIEVEESRLTDAGIGLCRQCGNGWGTCKPDHECQTKDGFQKLHQELLGAEALVFVTPVYWGELSESMKAFTDRLRRCEATRKEETPLKGKFALGIAAAGGGGGGTMSCSAQMERLFSHIGLRRFDLIGVTRWSREHSLVSITEAAQALGKSLKSNG